MKNVLHPCNLSGLRFNCLGKISLVHAAAAAGAPLLVNIRCSRVYAFNASPPTMPPMGVPLRNRSRTSNPAWNGVQQVFGKPDDLQNNVAVDWCRRETVGNSSSLLSRGLDELNLFTV